MLSFNYGTANLTNLLQFPVIIIKTRDTHHLSTKKKGYSMNTYPR